MKIKVIISVIAFWAFLIIASTCSGQVLLNGAGFFENQTTQSDQWLHELNCNLTLRLPGGAIAKFADPLTTPKGWGLTHTGIDSIQLAYGNPEEDAGGVDKWYQKADVQPNHSYLDDIVTFCNNFPNTHIIWVANIFIPAQRTVDIVQYLVSRGVNVVAVECGNETYSQLGYDFNRYKLKSAPLRVALKADFPQIAFSEISAPAKGRPEQTNWNDALAAYLISGDLVTFHYYLTSYQCPSINLCDPKVLKYGTVEAESAFLAVQSEIIGLQSWTGVLTQFDAVGFICSELNSKPSSALGNTFLNAAYLYWQLCSEGSKFTEFGFHNGVSPDIFGIISGKVQVKNTHYYSIKMFGSGNGKDRFWTVNGMTSDRLAHYYHSDYLSSSVMQLDSGYVIPANSFGYIDNLVGCQDILATNYNPAANIPGECVYPDIYGCTDKTATNYSDLATIDNGSCVYAECLKKRWLFTSLPCKPAKRNCNCH